MNFRFLNPVLNHRFDVQLGRDCHTLKNRKQFLQYCASALVEISNVKMEKILFANIPESHKQIAREIRDEEVRDILREFREEMSKLTEYHLL